MSEKFALIGAEEADPTSPYSVMLMCELLEVSTSGFYDWCSAVISVRARRRATVSTHVQAAFDAGRGAYGVRRVQQVLARCTDPQVASVSLKMVRSVMAELDLHACQPRAYKVTTVQDGSVAPTIPDLLHRDFSSEVPGAKLVGDIKCRRRHLTSPTSLLPGTGAVKSRLSRSGAPAPSPSPGTVVSRNGRGWQATSPSARMMSRIRSAPTSTPRRTRSACTRR